MRSVFFSVFLVFMSHLPYLKLFPSLSFLQMSGEAGVNFFFTLSGFLITYIILEQKAKAGTFNFKNYIIRRLLRIWPLYYVILIFAIASPYLLAIAGITGGNDGGYQPNWLMSFLFLENYMVIYHGQYANVTPLPVTWTVCIEEHFYIIWGLVLYFNKSKNIPYWIGAFIVTAFVARGIFFANGLMFKDLLTNFDFFMYGAIPAWLYANRREAVLAYVEKINDGYKALLIVILVAFVTTVHLYDYNMKDLIEPPIFGALYIGLLFIILPKHNRFSISDKSIFSRLGVYTYGLYLFHGIVVIFAAKVYQMSGIAMPEIGAFIAVFLCAGLVTVAAASLSYHLFEKQMLKLKPKY